MLSRRISRNGVTKLLQTTFYRFAESRIVIDDMHQRPINFHLHSVRPPGIRPRECVGWSDMTLSGLFLSKHKGPLYRVRPATMTLSRRGRQSAVLAFPEQTQSRAEGYWRR